MNLKTAEIFSFFDTKYILKTHNNATCFRIVTKIQNLSLSFLDSSFYSSFFGHFYQLHVFKNWASFKTSSDKVSITFTLNRLWDLKSLIFSHSFHASSPKQTKILFHSISNCKKWVPLCLDSHWKKWDKRTQSISS